MIQIYVACDCCDLYLHHTAMQPNRNTAGPSNQRPAEFPMPHQRRATAHTREEVVHRAVRHHPVRRPLAFRLHLHRGLLRVHVLLGLQDLLRLRLHASRLSHSHRRHYLCHHRHYLLLAQRRRLQMVTHHLSFIKFTLSFPYNYTQYTF